MKTTTRLLAGSVICAIFASCNTTENRMESNIKAPVAEMQDHKLEMHGDVRTDEYYWMKDRENEKVIDYLNAENDYTKAVMQDTETFQAELFEEMKGRIKEDDASVPYKKNGYYYLTKYVKGGEYPIYSRKEGSLEAEEEVLFDVNKMAEGFAYYQLGSYAVAPNNKLASYGVDTLSRRIYTIRVKNLETDENYPEEIENTTGSVAWASDNKTFFYMRKDPVTLRPYQVFRHVLGTDPSEDVMVYEEQDDTFSTGVYRSKSGDFIMIYTGATLSTEYRYLDATKPMGEFKVFEPRGEKHEYSVAHYKDHFYMVTNWEAKNFRLMKTPVGKTEKENWTEVIAHREDVLLEDIEIFKNFYVVSERENGLINMNIKSWDGAVDYALDFGEETYLAYSSTNPEFDTDVLRYGYTSMTTPSSIIDFNMVSKEKTIMKEQEVLGGKFDKSNYVSERIWATAKDGSKVPMSMVYRKGFVKDGNAPVLLYAYGSYGATMDPYFSTVRLSLLDRGFAYVIAHIRGGQYLGRQWYEDGKMFKKINTFTDYIDCAQHLIDEKYTSAEHLYAMGGSAGGLLMGAVVNMAPEKFNGVVAAVPFVDVVTTMLDDSIPLTTGEYDEWGNPNNKDSYDYMKSYSPYDNVAKQDYPNMLVTSGLHDSQVQYFEPTKWVARLRTHKTDQNMLLLHTNMEAGHGGASGRFESLKEVALEYAFMFKLEGITE